MKEIAVDGCTFKYTITVAPPSYSVQDPTDGAIVTPPSVKCKAGAGMHKDSAAFTATVMAPPPSLGTVMPPTFPVNGSFISTATKVKADMMPVLLKGDKTAAMTASFTDTNPGTGATVPIVVTVIAEIDDPGQTKAVAN